MINFHQKILDDHKSQQIFQNTQFKRFVEVEENPEIFKDLFCFRENFLLPDGCCELQFETYVFYDDALVPL